MTDSFDELHAPLFPILRHALATTPLPCDGWVLDLASGTGGKLPLLAEAFGPNVQFILLDRSDLRFGVNDLRLGAATIQNPKSKIQNLILADAHAVPLRAGSIAAVCCIAALSLFADPARALAEMRRVLRPDGTALIVTAGHSWAQTTRWPAALAAQIGAAYAAALHNGASPLPAPDVGDDLATLLREAGFATPQVRAFLLDAPTPAEAETTLLPWRALRPLIAARLDAALLARCDAEAEHDVELCALALIATG